MSAYRSECMHGPVHVFKLVILLQITDRSLCVYCENPNWGTAEPENPAPEIPLFVNLPKSSRNKVTHPPMHDSDFGALNSLVTVGWQHNL